MTYNANETSLALPIEIFKIGYRINPMAMPSAILYVNGIMAMIKIAGKLSLISFKSRLRMF